MLKHWTTSRVDFYVFVGHRKLALENIFYKEGSRFAQASKKLHTEAIVTWETKRKRELFVM